MYVIAVVGAGGKTTRIKRLTDQYVRQGKRVLVTTTTHMYQEPGMILNGKLEDIRHQLDKQNYCICGMPTKETNLAHCQRKFMNRHVDWQILYWWKPMVPDICRLNSRQTTNR